MDYAVPESLLNKSLKAVVTHARLLMIGVGQLPPAVKEKIFHRLCKRGFINNGNVHWLAVDRLKLLDLCDTEISDEGLKKLPLCRMLKKLDLNSGKGSRTNVTTEGLARLLQTSPLLDVVYLRRCTSITDATITLLSEQCPCLRELNIGGCSLVSDASLKSLSQSSRFLESISVSRTKVTDEGIFSLSKGVCAPCLKEVQMCNCNGITDEAVEAVMMFCPRINILTFHGCVQITERSRLAMEQLTFSRPQMKQITWTVY